MMTPILEVNKYLLDILKIDTDASLIEKVEVKITPDAYPQVIITQFVTTDYGMQSRDTRFELKEKEDVTQSKWKPKYFIFEGTQKQVVQFKYILDDKGISSMYRGQHLDSKFDPNVGQIFELMTSHEIETEEAWNELEGLKLYIEERYKLS